MLSKTEGQAQFGLAVLNLPPLKVLIALFLVYFVWGSTYLALATIVHYIPPFLVNGLRFMVAGSLLMLILRLSGHPPPSRIQWRNAILCGSLMTGISSGFVSYSIQYVDSGLAALGIASIPLWAAIFASIWERRPTRLEVWGLLVGFAGVLVLNFSPSFWANPWGGLAMLTAPIMWSFGTVWSRQLDMPKGAMSSAALLLCGGSILTAAGFLRGERLGEIPPTGALLAWAYLIVFGSMITFSAYNYLLRHTSPVLATSYAYVNPIVAVALGAVFLGEALTLTTLIAGALILGSILMINWASRPGSRPTTALKLR
jgi:drug/metabolite transporter (DMT)-like permease